MFGNEKFRHKILLVLMENLHMHGIVLALPKLQRFRRLQIAIWIHVRLQLKQENVEFLHMGNSLHSPRGLPIQLNKR